MKTWWAVLLVEHGDPNRVLDLGAYLVESREDAQKKASTKFRNLIRKLETAAFTLDAHSAPDPRTVVPAGTRKRFVDKTVDWVGK